MHSWLLQGIVSLEIVKGVKREYCHEDSDRDVHHGNDVVAHAYRDAATAPHLVLQHVKVVHGDAPVETRVPLFLLGLPAEVAVAPQALYIHN